MRGATAERFPRGHQIPLGPCFFLLVFCGIFAAGAPVASGGWPSSWSVTPGTRGVNELRRLRNRLSRNSSSSVLPLSRFHFPQILEIVWRRKYTYVVYPPLRAPHLHHLRHHPVRWCRTCLSVRLVVSVNALFLFLVLWVMLLLMTMMGRSRSGVSTALLARLIIQIQEEEEVIICTHLLRKSRHPQKRF